MAGGTELLLIHGVFTALVVCGQRNICNPSIMAPLFHLCACLMHDKADYSKYVHVEMTEAFISAGGLSLACEALCHVTDPCDFQCRCSVLLPVFPVTEVEDGLVWLRNHLDELLSPFREFAIKKDILAYWTEGEQVKTVVMWERFKDNFSRIFLEVHGSSIECAHVALEHDMAIAPLHHALPQNVVGRCRSPPLQPKRNSQKTSCKKMLRPRSIQTVLQVTFTEGSRVPQKARRVVADPQKQSYANALTNSPTVFELMSRAPTRIPATLPLQGYANAVKSNLPKEVSPLETVSVRFVNQK